MKESRLFITICAADEGGGMEIFMKEIIEYTKSVIGDSRDKEAAKKAIEILVEKTKDMDFELDRTYFVSEWSWTPISDGNFVYEETIRAVKDCGLTKAYCTNTSHRTYFPWDLFDNQSDCKMMCDFKSSFSYDWEMAIGEFATSIHAMNDMGSWR